MESEPSFKTPCSTAHQNARTKSIERGKKRSACSTRLAHWRQNGSQRSKCQPAGQSKSLICERLWDPPVFGMSQNRVSLWFVHVRVIFFNIFHLCFFSLQGRGGGADCGGKSDSSSHFFTDKKKNSPSNLSKVWIKGGLRPTIPATFRHSHQLHAAIAPAVRRWGSARGLNVFLALFIYRDISLNNCSICTAFCKTVNVPKMGAVVAFQGDLLERL